MTIKNLEFSKILRRNIGLIDPGPLLSPNESVNKMSRDMTKPTK